MDNGPFQFLSDPPVLKTLEFQPHFISSNPMEDCGFVDVFSNLIHGEHVLNGLVGYQRHRISMKNMFLNGCHP